SGLIPVELVPTEKVKVFVTGWARAGGQGRHEFERPFVMVGMNVVVDKIWGSIPGSIIRKNPNLCRA
ncbi:MAG: hypothetical protein WBQ94_13205, partial [Terracidiphilus sp.]